MGRIPGSTIYRKKAGTMNGMQYGSGADPVSSHELTEKERRTMVGAVANSNTFLHSPTLRSFFVYVAEHALAGRLDEIKEQRIGWHVLGRKPDYDTANDNIVRIRARQVRQKLDEYFSTEGRDSTWIITIPKGGYVPVFQLRPEAPARMDTQTVAVHLNSADPRHDVKSDPPSSEANSPASLETQHLQPPAPASPRPRQHAVLVRLLPWLIAGAATLALGVYFWSKQEAHPYIQRPATETSGLWKQFFPTAGKEVTVVVADSGFSIWQDFTHRTQSLGDYVGRAFLREPDNNPSVSKITSTPYTSLADAILTARISETAMQFGGRINVKHARNMDIHDFSNKDMVLLGSHSSDPWVELFEPHMNFVLEQDHAVGLERFRNRSPQAGESQIFDTSRLATDEGSEESYAVVAFLPSLGGSGHVLILEGLDMEGTEAAGEFVLNPEKFGALLQRAGVARGAKLRPFEALIKLRAIRGGFEALELVAFRYGDEGVKTSALGG